MTDWFRSRHKHIYWKFYGTSKKKKKKKKKTQLMVRDVKPRRHSRSVIVFQYVTMQLNYVDTRRYWVSSLCQVLRKVV